MSGPNLLDVSGITIRFGGVVALADVSFHVETGELFAVIGPNGAGKSTIFNCLSGLFRPEGSIKLKGVELVGRRPPEVAALGVARTFQNLGLFDSMNVIENLMIGRHVRMHGGVINAAMWLGSTRRSEAAARLRCHEMVDLLDLGDYRNTPVAQLPYGIRKRVELGKALAMDPTLLLLDEPVAGMNREETEQLVGYITVVREQLNLTIILIEHDMGLVMELADRVLALDFGKMIGVGLPEEIQRNPQVIEAYLGIGSADAKLGPELQATGEPRTEGSR